MVSTRLLHVIATAPLVSAISVQTGPASTIENAHVTEKFHEYIRAQRRSYSAGTDEYGQRREIFQHRVNLIALHNSKEVRLWTAGMNDLTDRTDEELRQLRGWRRTGPVGQTSAAGASLLAETSKVVEEPEASVDWRSLSMASDIPNQGGCGSCWAVATAAMLQGRHEVQKKANRTFSSQQLVNCVPNPLDCGGEGGCQGATVELAMKYIESKGLAPEELEPYVGSDGECKQPTPQPDNSVSTSFLASRRQASLGAANLGLQSWHKLAENKALPLMLALADGPVAVSVGASDWTLYSNGIFDGCSKDAVIDHAVVLFGFGKGSDGAEKGNNYWLVRNSWGAYWGEDGYIRLLRQSTVAEEDGHCGNDNDPKAGVACKPYPDSVTVCGQCGILYDSVAANFEQATQQY